MHKANAMKTGIWKKGMCKLRCWGIFFGLLLHSTIGLSQLADSTRLLSPIQFMEWVRKNHPVAKQAALYIDQAEAELLATRGLFDPMLYYTSVQKTFDSKTYYNYKRCSVENTYMDGY
jgi:hypothetical protein